jgi:putative transposase
MYRDKFNLRYRCQSWRIIRIMRSFRDPKRTQTFLSCCGPIRQHFATKRHGICASLYRKQLAARFVAWREFAELARNPSTAF